MYSKILEPKVNEMFEELKKKVSEITANSTLNTEQAGYAIAKAVASETTKRSKTMLSDMFDYLSEKILETPEFSDISMQKKFYELNLLDEIANKYQFDVPKNIDFKEADKMLKSLIAGAGTATIGGTVVIGGTAVIGNILKFALTPKSFIVPVALVIAASIAAYCISYFAVVPNSNKNKFNESVNKFLDEIQYQFLAWFDEIEKYFYKRVDELK